MLIKMRTKSAGPEGVMLPGQIYNVSEEMGRDLVSGGYAELVKQPTPAEKPVAESKKEASKAEEPAEVEAVEPQETAAEQYGKAQGRKRR